ncbi:MAG: SemiSWEET transporter [Bacteroidota bacterium]
MNLTGIIGVSASVFTATSLIPQLIKLIKEKKSENISLGMMAVLFIGLVLWIWYGFLKEDWIIIISNGFSLMINLITVILSLKYKTK